MVLRNKVQGDFNIGEWRIQPRINAIEHNGTVHRLEPKVMQVLVALAKDPGEVVSRERLRETVWPDVFVGEDVLIRAISEIRRAFGDDPKSPHTIQTVHKSGYRLIAAVSEAPSEILEPTLAPAVEPVPDPTSNPDSASSKSRALQRWTVAFAAVVCLMLLTLVGLRHFATRQESPVAYTLRPLTTYPGFQLQPTLSPDGNTVAFVWRKPGESNGHIYIRAISSEQAVRLTTSEAEELCPAWSSDGRRIAFIQRLRDGDTIQVMSAFGGAQQEVHRLLPNSVWEYGGLVWSTDGKNLIFPERPGEDQASRLVMLDLDSRQTRPITMPPADWDGDWTPAISPDGKWLSFVRGVERSARDLYVMELPSGPPKRLTNDNALIVGSAWSEDSKRVIFSSSRAGSVSLWSVDRSGGLPIHEAVGGDSAYAPTISVHGNRLVYSRGNATWTVARVDLREGSKAPETEILSSTEQDSAPALSPAGDKMAFQSWRSGTQEIWEANTNGTNAVQLTSAGNYAGSPSWSPDGRWICFDARTNGISHVYVIDSDGGLPRQLTSGESNDIVPSWSPDGEWIYFGSNRSGSWEIWRVGSSGTEGPERITTGGGMVAKSSLDGRWIYFTRFAEPGLWRQLLARGKPEKISDDPPEGSQDYWTPTTQGVFLLTKTGAGNAIKLFDPDTKQEKLIYDFKYVPSPFAGLTATSDAKTLFFAELTQAGSNLRLVDGFE